jgi:hypothetical protein
LKEIAKAIIGCITLTTLSLVMVCTRFPMLVKTPHIEEVGLGLPMLDILYATYRNFKNHMITTIISTWCDSKCIVSL